MYDFSTLVDTPAKIGYNQKEVIIPLNALTYIFPAATLLLIILFYFGTPSLKSAELESSEEKSFCRLDCILLALIVILYSAVAFYNLGDTKAPQSFCHFRYNDSVTVDMGEDTAVNEILYYSGLNTGKCVVEYSHDGEFFYAVGCMDQKYSALLKWNSVEFMDGADSKTRYIRITSDSDLYIGEMSIRTGKGVVTGEGELFDEQSLVPDYMTYLNSSYFDEIYHARTAYENIEGIYPYEISHPPLGKLIIAGGIELLGMTPFGWRFSGTLFGVLMLPVLFVFLKKMFGGTAVPACGTAIFAADFMHFTQTRIATIDTYAVFFILLMYLFMYLYVTGGRLRYLALSGVFFGIGAACKWTCFYAGAGLAVIWLIHWMRNFELKGFIKNCLFCLCFFVLIPAAIYYVSYFPYAQARGMSGAGMFFTKDYADIVLGNQQFMFDYHSGVHSEHPYSSRWYQWVLNIRPILYYLQYYTDGKRSSFGAFLNPVLCWAGLIAIFINAYLAVSRRDRTAEFIVIGYLAQLLPWVFITRTTFEYHYFPSAVFLLLAICRVFSLMKNNRRDWRISVCGLTGMSVALFVLFYPVLSGKLVDSSLASSLLKWLPSWPF